MLDWLREVKYLQIHHIILPTVNLDVDTFGIL